MQDTKFIQNGSSIITAQAFSHGFHSGPWRSDQLWTGRDAKHSQPTHDYASVCMKVELVDRMKASTNESMPNLLLSMFRVLGHRNPTRRVV